MALNQNQLVQQPVQGQMDLRFNSNVLSVQVDVTSAGGLIPGQPVKMVDSVGGIPKVVECASDADDVLGFIAFDIKSAKFDAGDRCEIALVDGAGCMYMTSAAAIARKAQLAIVFGTPGQVQTAVAASGKTVVGYAFDKATAAGQLIRVMMLPPKVVA